MHIEAFCLLVLRVRDILLSATTPLHIPFNKHSEHRIDSQDGLCFRRVRGLLVREYGIVSRALRAYTSYGEEGAMAAL